MADNWGILAWAGQKYNLGRSIPGSNCDKISKLIWNNGTNLDMLALEKEPGSLLVFSKSRISHDTAQSLHSS